MNNDPPPVYAATMSNAVFTQPPSYEQNLTFGPIIFNENPMQMECYSCKANIITRLSYVNGSMTWLICLGLSCFCVCCGCQFIPFCIDGN